MVSNLEYYKSFYYVANLESFSAAANQLHLTQSAVSQSIKKLEDELSCQLFIRTSKSTSLTPAGEELYKHVQTAFSEFQKGEKFVSDMITNNNKELTIGATETSIRFFLPEFLNKWRSDNPDTRLNLVGSTTTELCSMLINDSISEAFLISPIPNDVASHLQLKKIGEVQDVPVVSRTFFDKEMSVDISQKLSLKEISTFPLIFVSAENSVRKLFNQWFLSEDIIFNPQYTVPHMGLVLSLVQQNLGIGFLPLPYLKKATKSEDLIALNMNSLPTPRDVYLAKKSM